MFSRSTPKTTAKGYWDMVVPDITITLWDPWASIRTRFLAFQKRLPTMVLQSITLPRDNKTRYLAIFFSPAEFPYGLLPKSISPQVAISELHVDSMTLVPLLGGYIKPREIARVGMIRASVRRVTGFAPGLFPKQEDRQNFSRLIKSWKKVDSFVVGRTNIIHIVYMRVCLLNCT